MQRGTHFAFSGSVPMQRGDRLGIFHVPLGGPTWPSEGVLNIYKTNVILHILQSIEKRWCARSGCRTSEILKIRWQKSILGMNKCVPMQRGARFSSKRGSLEEGSWDAFLPYRSKSRFSGPSNNPLQADYSFEQNGCSQKGVLRGIRLGRIFALSVKKQFFRTPI